MTEPDHEIRRRFRLRGTVQGVGMRPWVYRLATARGLGGWVLNDSEGVVVEVQGPAAQVAGFGDALAGRCASDGERPPPLSRIEACEAAEVGPRDDGGATFEIRPSQTAAAATDVPPDMVVCDACRRELLDPADRRYRYPFINCTHCGPRYSIVLDVPYDRRRTTMGQFGMCAACLREYEDPSDRRFHAQPNACPECGPRLTLCDARGGEIECDDAVEEVRRGLIDGRLVVIKGLTGYHLACDATSEAAVGELRRRKRRDEKPLALMVADASQGSSLVRLDEASRRLLESAERPIVLVRRRDGAAVASGVAPRSGYLGLMLPYAPIHVLLFEGGLPPLVMTSANLSDEPMCRDNAETVARMDGIADLYLLHDRGIETICDDSVATVQCGEPLVIRRARGYAPRPIRLPGPAAGATILAVGPELKNSVCLTRGAMAYVSQHIGDLKSPLAAAYFEETIDKLSRLLEVGPEVVACDLHPAYLSTRYARGLGGVRLTAVQHHHAHIASVAAEHGLTEPLLGLAMDGTGYGEDGTVWGGEFLDVRPDGAFARLGHLAYVPLPGGDAAVRQVARIAWAWLVGAYGDEAEAVAARRLPATTAEQRTVWRQMMEQGLNSPRACGLGRLFDAAAALTGVADHSSYEGQAAIELEAAADPRAAEPFDFEMVPGAGGDGPFEVALWPMIRGMVEALDAGEGAGRVAARVHETVAAMLLGGARRMREITGRRLIGLSGGCFLNRRLTEGLTAALEGEGFTVLRHREVSPGDGGVALGQAEVARQRLAAGAL
jgi:hydrogenase maturation protein HypF